MDAKRTPAGAMLSPDAGLAETRPTLTARDRVIEQLGDAFAHGTLDVDEFERRVTVAHQSDSQPRDRGA